VEDLAKKWRELLMARPTFGGQEGTKIYTQYLARRDKALDKHERLKKSGFESAATRHMMRAILYQHSADAVLAFLRTHGDTVNFVE